MSDLQSTVAACDRLRLIGCVQRGCTNTVLHERRHMYRLITSNAPAVVHALRRIGDLREYTQLRASLTTDSESASSEDFQRKYRKYWRMNAARLPSVFHE